MKTVGEIQNIRIDRVWSMPNKHTFEIKPIKDLLNDEVDLSLLWIDPFANRNKIARITNDLNPEYDTDYHLDALDFLRMFDNESVDGVLYDPPYSPRQVSECYNDVGYNVTWDTTKASFWGNHKREISRIVKIGGKVITFGWNSGGIGYKYGFEIQRILMVPHGGWHNDTICTVEIKTHNSIFAIENNKKKFIKEMPMLTHEDEQLIKELSGLPIDYWDFKEDDTKEYTHGIHSYPAMMVYPISRNIINIVKKVRPINALLDPFTGSGTVLVEGMLSGIKTVTGNDINPLAVFLSKAKTTYINPNDLFRESSKLLTRIKSTLVSLQSIIDNADDYIASAFQLDLSDKKGWGDNAPIYLKKYCQKMNININVPNFKNIGYWFKPQVILTLSIIKDHIEHITDENIRNYTYVAMSECIRLVSNRRNGEFKMFRMPATKVLKFKPNVYEVFSKILLKNVEKMQDFYTALGRNLTQTQISVFQYNTCNLSNIPNETYDLIITSPPYGDSRTTVAYGEYSRLSLQWINIDKLNDKEIMGVDKSLMGGKKYQNGFEFDLKSETLQKSLCRIKDADIERAGDVYSFYKDLDVSINEVAKKTKSGGYQFWVVGNRTVKNELLQTDVIITELAQQYGLIPIYSINRNIPNKVMPSRNSPTNKTGITNTTMTMEHIVILRKK